ncbi:MAG: hypoxanthine/guanine phosphoribosyltransferase [Halobacteria archaeon]|nr:hypoxanthine/guanine phosphoribosyltransferase [Halobacteria archaeon]
MEKLRQSLLDAPIIEKEKDGEVYEYFVHPITDGVPPLEPSLLREIVVGIVRVADVDSVDRIVAPEAMGIHVGTALSLATDVPLSVVRKRSYGFDSEVSVKQVTGYSEGEMYVNNVEEGDRLLLVDDVLSTGGTLTAVHDALEEAGGEVVDTVAVIRKGEDADVEGFEVKSLVTADVVDGEVVVEDTE